MRGADEQSGSMFSYVSLEARVPPDHPLRAIRRITDQALEQLSPRFGALYIHFGRPSVPPEKLLRALLLQALYTIRSERQLMEQLDYNLLFRWFVGLGMDDAVWSPTTFSKNRDRLLDGDITGLSALENAIDVRGRAPVLVPFGHPVRHEPSPTCEFIRPRHRRYPHFLRERRNPVKASEVDERSEHGEPADSLPPNGSERSVQVFAGPHGHGIRL